MHSHHDLGHMYNEGLASSAPSHKLGYENLAGAPPMFASSSFQGVGPIRRHRSATPTIRQQQQMQQFGSPGSSIPSSSSSSLFALRSTSISVANNGAERSHGYHPYASRSRDFFSTQTRYGAHLTGLRTGNYEWSVAAGHIADSYDRDGIYARVGVSLRPPRPLLDEN